MQIKTGKKKKSLEIRDVSVTEEKKKILSLLSPWQQYNIPINYSSKLLSFSTSVMNLPKRLQL